MTNFESIDGLYFPSDVDADWLRNVKKEIWEDNEYDRYGIQIHPGDIVLDFGANVGAFTKYALSKGAHHVYAFEAQDHYFDCLSLNCRNDYNVTKVKGFISDRFEYGHYNFPTIFDKFNLGRVNFCKVDIEYWEYPLLLNASSEDIKKIDQFAIEVHDIYENYYKVFEILEMFSKNNFATNFEHIHKDYNLGMIYAKNKSL